MAEADDQPRGADTIEQQDRENEKLQSKIYDAAFDRFGKEASNRRPSLARTPQPTTRAGPDAVYVVTPGISTGSISPWRRHPVVRSHVRGRTTGAAPA